MRLWLVLLIGGVLVTMSRKRFSFLPVPQAAWDTAVAARAARGLRGAGSPFGMRDDPLKPGTQRMHAGTDVAVPTGTPLICVDDGIVTEVSRGAAGLVVRYQTAHGRVSCMHLDSLAPRVAVGATVSAGEVIGATGASGNVTGPHLHFELRPLGASSSVDPLPYFPAGSERVA